jgi:hypothetical protein
MPCTRDPSLAVLRKQSAESLSLHVPVSAAVTRQVKQLLTRHLAWQPSCNCPYRSAAGPLRTSVSGSVQLVLYVFLDMLDDDPPARFSGSARKHASQEQQQQQQGWWNCGLAHTFHVGVLPSALASAASATLCLLGHHTYT